MSNKLKKVIAHDAESLETNNEVWIVNQIGSSKYIRLTINNKSIPLTAIQLVELIRKGVSKQTLSSLVQIIGFEIKELSPIIHLPFVKLSKLKEDAILSSEQTEKIIQLAQLCEIGERVFGDIGKFNRWLRKESQALGGQIPLNLLDTSIGFQVVSEELLRIEHGIFA